MRIGHVVAEYSLTVSSQVQVSDRNIDTAYEIKSTYRLGIVENFICASDDIINGLTLHTVSHVYTVVEVFELVSKNAEAVRVIEQSVPAERVTT